MKNVMLSADGSSKVYSVPDIVADNLEDYCFQFIDWLYSSPQAQKYIKDGAYVYNESDFIEYLDNIKFVDEQCVFVENLGFVNNFSELPEKYTNIPYFNF